MSERGEKQAKAISIVMILTLLGKLLGLLRDHMLSVTYGSGMETNAFLTASRIPRVFFDAVFASAIASCFIPVFSEIMAKKGKEEAFRFSGNFLTVMGVLTLALTVLGTVFAQPLVVLFADGYDAQTTALCVDLTRMMFPTVLFTGVAFSLVGILQSLGEFNIPALISTVSNCIVIGYYFTFNGKFGIYGLAVAFLIGWLMQAVVQVPSLHRLGYRYRPDFHFRTEGIKKVFALMLPVMVSTWVQPINLTINSRFGSHLYNGAGVTAIEFANNLYLIIAGVFVLSVTNVIFPEMSRQAAGEARDKLRDTISGTVHTCLYFVCPMMAGLMVLAEPIVDFIYGGGQFDQFSVGITADALVFVSLGMVGYALQNILSRAYFACQEGKAPLLAGFLGIAVNIVLCILLVDRFSVTGLAVSSAVSSTVYGLALAFPLRRRGLGFWTKSFAVDMLKITAATVAMALCVWGARMAVSGLLPGVAGKLLVLCVPAAVGIIAYFALTALLGLGEMKLILSKLKRRR